MVRLFEGRGYRKPKAVAGTLRALSIFALLIPEGVQSKKAFNRKESTLVSSVISARYLRA